MEYLGKKIYTKAKIQSFYFCKFLKKNNIPFNRHSTRSSHYVTVNFGYTNFLVRISDHDHFSKKYRIPDYQILCNKSFDKTKKQIKKMWLQSFGY